MKEVETNIQKRWELGIEHHPRSVELFEQIRRIDWENEDYFCWKSGGDGDNGEELMYILDIIFEKQDIG